MVLYLNHKHVKMKKVKVIDLFGVRYDNMEEMINGELEALQAEGKTITEVKVMGQKLSQCAVFVVYEG